MFSTSPLDPLRYGQLLHASHHSEVLGFSSGGGHSPLRREPNPSPSPPAPPPPLMRTPQLLSGVVDPGAVVWECSQRTHEGMGQRWHPSKKTLVHESAQPTSNFRITTGQSSSKFNCRTVFLFVRTEPFGFRRGHSRAFAPFGVGHSQGIRGHSRHSRRRGSLGNAGRARRFRSSGSLKVPRAASF